MLKRYKIYTEFHFLCTFSILMPKQSVLDLTPAFTRPTGWNIPKMAFFIVTSLKTSNLT
jgi:hypothetical protein